MKYIATFILLIYTSVNYVYAQEGIFDNQTKESIINNFNNALNGNKNRFDNHSYIALDSIEILRNNVWDLWRNTVNNFNEDKLIPLSNLSKRNTGKWSIPANLEPDAVMPYYWGINGDGYEEGEKYPMFLYMHGSGDKEQEWETGISLSLKKFYSPGVYMVPQIPNGYGEYYRWAIQSKQWAWEKLLRLAFLNDTIDANRIYFFGISEGGYGSQRLASFYADYLAGAGPMAGGEPLKNAPMENLANIAFSLRTGASDNGFGRNILTQKALEVADELENAHPGFYNHYIETIPYYGHSIDYGPTTPWLAQFKRNPRPDYFYWEEYDMYGRRREGFYNIRLNETSRLNDSQRSCYELNIKNNTIILNVKNVEYTTTYSQNGIEMFFSKEYSDVNKGNITIFISEKQLDLSKPVKLVVNGTEIYNAIVPTSLNAMIESCALFFDPERVFPAYIDVDIADMKASTTDIEVTKSENSTVKVYDLNGRKVEAPNSRGIYIINGEKIFVK